MRVAAIIPIAIFFATAVVVGMRLLLLSHRTRQLPEFSIGLGITLISVVGTPLTALGRLPGTIGTPFGDGVFAVGFSCVGAGVALLFVFTWSVFRDGAGWARNAVFVAALTVAFLAAGLIHAASQERTLAEIIPRTRPWATAFVMVLVLAFAWTGSESLRYYGQLRRRQVLGLSDPVVANRFLLWGVAGWTAVALCLSIVGFLLAGTAVLVDPMALSIIAASGLVMSATWYLTFFPPAFYLRLIVGASRRAPGDGSAQGL